MSIITEALRELKENLDDINYEIFQSEKFNDDATGYEVLITRGDRKIKLFYTALFNKDGLDLDISYEEADYAPYGSTMVVSSPAGYVVDNVEMSDDAVEIELENYVVKIENNKEIPLDDVDVAIELLGISLDEKDDLLSDIEDAVKESAEGD